MRKKLFAILMSAMMMVTFMPAMSFGAATVHKYGHENVVASTTAKCGAEAVKYVAQTCEKCSDETLKEVKFTQKHQYKTVNLTADELVAVLSKQAFKAVADAKEDQRVLTKLNIVEDILDIKTDLQQKLENVSAEVRKAQLINAAYDVVLNASQAYVKSLGSKCKYYIDYCEACDNYDMSSMVATDHVKPETTAPCAEKFICTQCNKEVAIAGSSDYEQIAKHVADLKAAVNNGKITNMDQAKEAIAALMDVKAPGLHKWVRKAEQVGCGTTVEYKCEYCQDVKTAFHPNMIVKNHTFEPYVLVDHSCTHDGVEVQRCKYCGYISPFGIKFTKKLGHMLTPVTVEPTCTTVGYTFNMCENCQKIIGLKHKFVKATGHAYKYTSVVDATCSSAGLYKVSCENCDKVEFFYNTKSTIFTGFDKELKTFQKIPSTLATGHDYNLFVEYTPATCDKNAVMARQCSKCGHLGACTGEVKEMKGTALGHTYELKTVAPTCKTAGYSVNVCTTCGKSYKDEFGNETKYLSKAKFDVVAAIGGEHDFTGNWVTYKKATIFEEGTKAVTCAKCGIVEPASYKEAVDKLTYGKPITRVNGKKITVTVTKKTDAVKYAVQIRNTGYDNWKTIKTLTKPGTVTKTLKKGGYSIRILATSKDGLKAYSQHTKIKIK